MESSSTNLAEMASISDMKEPAVVVGMRLEFWSLWQEIMAAHLVGLIGSGCSSAKTN